MNQECFLAVHHTHNIILGVKRPLSPPAIREGLRARVRVRVRIRVRASYPTHSTVVALIIHN